MLVRLSALNAKIELEQIFGHNKHGMQVYFEL